MVIRENSWGAGDTLDRSGKRRIGHFELGVSHIFALPDELVPLMEPETFRVRCPCRHHSGIGGVAAAYGVVLAIAVLVVVVALFFLGPPVSKIFISTEGNLQGT